VRAVVERALAADPEQRWPSATDLATTARRAAAADPTAPDPTAPGPTALNQSAAPDPTALDQSGPGPVAFAPARVAVPGPPPVLPPTMLEPPSPAPASPPSPVPAAPSAPPTPAPPPPAHPGWPAAPPLPGTVFVANLLLLAAAASLFIYCVGSASVMDIVEVETRRALGDQNEDLLGLVMLLGWAVIGVLLLIALLLGLLAWRNSRRSRGARAWTIVLGFFVLCCCAPLGVLSSAGGDATADQTEYQLRLAAAMPAWYEPVTNATGLVAALALLVSVVLLMLPPSNRFFRVLPPPTFYYAYYPYHHYPPWR
jgi:hypothetical protein